MTPALAIFVKTPGLSPVKTRLAATLGAADATRFHTLAAAATAAVARDCRPALTPYWAVAETAVQTRAAWPDFPHVAQGDGSLGARLHHVYAQLQERHGSVLLIGADAPQLTPAMLRQALRMLEDDAHAFVLGPASDGGFWLFGGRQPISRHVWLDVHYSKTDTAAQLRRTLAACETTGTLSRLTDVDTADDLPVLARSLDALPHPLPAQRELQAWLRDVFERTPRLSS